MIVTCRRSAIPHGSSAGSPVVRLLVRSPARSIASIASATALATRSSSASWSEPSTRLAHKCTPVAASISWAVMRR